MAAQTSRSATLRPVPNGISSLHLSSRAAVGKPLSRAASRFICQSATGSGPVANGISIVETPVNDAATPPMPPAMPYYPAYQQPGVAPEAVGQQVDPRYYQQPGAQGQQQYYMAPPPGYYPYAPPTQREESSSSGAPWFLWVGVGMAAAFAVGKVQEFAKKGPQQMMTEMMMKQAMGAMGAKPGASPFGTPGASPFGAPGSMPPFGGASPFGGATGSPFSPPATPAVDVSPTMSSATDKKGDKFSSRQSAENPPASKSSGGMDVVEPVVKEPAATSSSSGNGSPKPAFFTDVSLEEKAAKAAAASANVFEQQWQGMGQGQQTAGGTEGAGGDTMMNMMETMLRNPEMQKMLYPYLPEPMRNPSSIEWMLNNPEVKKQMATMFEQQNMMSPQMMDMMKGMDFNQDKVNAQFDELGLKPEDVISKVMSNPELASGFSNPKVQAAIIDISQNPMNIMKYQNDPEIMVVLEKVTEVFKPNEAPR